MAAPSRRFARHRGFTLIELLVVVAIVGVLVLAVTLSMSGAGGERQLAREAERFQAVLGFACNQAELSGVTYGVVLTPQSFGFRQLGSDGWHGLPKDGELRTRHWPEALRAQLTRDGRLIDLAQISDETPQLLCYASGELTPFALSLALGDAPARYVLSGHDDGVIELAHTARTP